MDDVGGVENRGINGTRDTYKDRVDITRLRPRRQNRDTVGFGECVLDQGGVWVPFLTKRGASGANMDNMDNTGKLGLNFQVVIDHSFCTP